MGSRYEQAVTALYRAPLESFVTERRQLAGELKAAGDKAGAAQLAKLARPPISAWVVNQLWYRAREAFDEMFETAAQLRAGKLSAAAPHRKAVMKLGAHAQQLLAEAGHSANDATLRRVTMTLASLAAAGSFAPDEPGTLTKDRDPPGFEAFGIVSSPGEGSEKEPAITQKPASHATHVSKATIREPKREAEATAAERKREAEATAAERKREAEAAAAERKREAEARAELQAERKKLQERVREAKAELAKREHERDHLNKQLAMAERELERARSALEAAQAELEGVASSFEP
jgi:hypothetical protein